MTLYMTKVWGFGSPCGPLQFSTKGARDTARRLLQPGDRVVVVGTQGEQTLEQERGRLLGIMEPTRDTVGSLDFDLQPEPSDFDEDGRYRWPFALHNRRAWVFDEPRPLLSSISQRRFQMDSALGIVPLLADEAEAALAFPHHEVPLLPAIRAIARSEGSEEAKRRGAPPPTTERRGVMHMRRAPAYTYLLEIEGANRAALKVGWAFDYSARTRGFNQAALPALGGLRYRPRLFQLWPEARQAFRMEQAVLRAFDGSRHPSNREVITGVLFGSVESAWINLVLRLSRPNPR